LLAFLLLGLEGEVEDVLLKSMLRRTVATLLLILTVSPFTPPFSTCDIPTLFGDGVPVGPHPTSLASPIEDGSHTVPLCAASGRIRVRMKHIARTETTASVHHMALPAGDSHTDVCFPGSVAHESLTPLRI